MVLLYGSSLVQLLLNVALFWLLFFRKEKLQRECLVAKEKAVIREENQKREYYVYYKSYMSLVSYVLFYFACKVISSREFLHL